VSRFKDQPNSTEKLLELIRGRADDGASKFEKEASSRPVFAPSGLNPTRFLQQISKMPTVGVDIGREYIRMVKTVRMPEGLPALAG